MNLKVLHKALATANSLEIGELSYYHILELDAPLWMTDNESRTTDNLFRKHYKINLFS